MGKIGEFLKSGEGKLPIVDQTKAPTVTSTMIPFAIFVSEIDTSQHTSAAIVNGAIQYPKTHML
jgi:hypothetical protein